MSSVTYYGHFRFKNFEHFTIYLEENPERKPIDFGFQSIEEARVFFEKRIVDPLSKVELFISTSIKETINRIQKPFSSRRKNESPLADDDFDRLAHRIDTGVSLQIFKAYTLCYTREEAFRSRINEETFEFKRELQKLYNRDSKSIDADAAAPLIRRTSFKLRACVINSMMHYEEASYSDIYSDSALENTEALVEKLLIAVKEIKRLQHLGKDDETGDLMDEVYKTSNDLCLMRAMKEHEFSKQKEAYSAISNAVLGLTNAQFGYEDDVFHGGSDSRGQNAEAKLEGYKEDYRQYLIEEKLKMPSSIERESHYERFKRKGAEYASNNNLARIKGLEAYAKELGFRNLHEAKIRLESMLTDADLAIKALSYYLYPIAPQLKLDKWNGLKHKKLSDEECRALSNLRYAVERMEAHGIERGVDMVHLLEKNDSRLLKLMDTLPDVDNVFDAVDIAVIKNQRKVKKFRAGKSWGTR